MAEMEAHHQGQVKTCVKWMVLMLVIGIVLGFALHELLDVLVRQGV